MFAFLHINRSSSLCRYRCLIYACPHSSQVQTIGFLSYLHHEISEAGRKPFLILGPLSTLPNWMSEFKRWCPSMKAIMYHGDKEKRAELRAGDLAPGATRGAVDCSVISVGCNCIKVSGSCQYIFTFAR